jgi:hypothetical protein
MEIDINNMSTNLQYTNTLYTPAENFSNVRYVTVIQNDFQDYNFDSQGFWQQDEYRKLLHCCKY